MADNLDTPLADNITLASDEVNGVHFPRTKVSVGADGTAADVSDVNPFPVKTEELVLDHTNATKTTVTASTPILTPPAGCKWVQIFTTGLTFIKTDNTAAADSAGSYPIEDRDLIPVTPGVAIRAFAPSSVTVYAIPFKNR